jgi:hypothetical protein
MAQVKQAKQAKQAQQAAAAGWSSSSPLTRSNSVPVTPMYTTGM